MYGGLVAGNLRGEETDTEKTRLEILKDLYTMGNVT